MMPDATPRLYTQTGCAESVQVRAWLRARDIPFVERDVTDDPAAARELAETGIFATPLLVAGVHRVLGFRPARLAAALGVEGW